MVGVVIRLPRIMEVPSATVVVRVMAAVVARVLSFLPNDSYNSSEQLQVAVIKGKEQTVTTRVLGLEAAATVGQDVKSIGVSMP